MARMAALTEEAVAASSAAVASSMSRTGVCRSSQRAMEMRCRSPPERPEPFSPQI